MCAIWTQQNPFERINSLVLEPLSWTWVWIIHRLNSVLSDLLNISSFGLGSGWIGFLTAVIFFTVALAPREIILQPCWSRLGIKSLITYVGLHCQCRNDLVSFFEIQCALGISNPDECYSNPSTLGSITATHCSLVWLTATSRNCSVYRIH